MDEKLSAKALEDYSDDYASKVTATFFASKERISGQEILNLCDIQQINLFVIRELLRAWKLETHKLRSPYFDYTAAPVADALTRFHNLLSNHIAISKENFQPLLKKAVSQTLYLILNPYDFYSSALAAHGESLRLDELRLDVKYIRINRIPLERLLADLESRKLPFISGKEAFATLDHILEEVNFTPDELDDYLARFSTVVPLALESLYDKAQENPVAESTPKPATPPVSETPPPTPKAEAVTPAEPPPAPKAPATPPKVESAPPKKEAAASKPEPKPAPAQIPLYDQQPGKGTTLAENFQKRRKIKDSLTINQKFMFTKILFNGDFELFSAAVERLDELDNLNQAKTYLGNNYGEWNPESEEYQEFMEIVERRFA